MRDPAGESAKILVTEEGGIALISLGRVEEKAVILDGGRMDSLRATFESLRGRNDLRGVVICGPRPEMFCAGADIHAIEGVEDPARGEELARMGQDIFQILSDLPQRTVAAISGPCVGGGCELVLACDHRIALDIPATKIGLPEIKLGILPGFGGTQRLPRLIGLPKALDIILKGKTVAAKQARSAGLVDEIVKGGAAKEELFRKLVERAKEIAGGTRVPKRRKLGVAGYLLTWSAVGRTILSRKVRQALMRETKGHYPAPLEALDSAVCGLSLGMEKGLRDERRRLGKLIVTPESKALVHVFYATEEAQKLGRSAREETASMRIGVVGAGTMGAGIASTFLAQGFSVSAVEPYAPVRDKLVPHAWKTLEKKRSLGKAERADALARLQVSADLTQLSRCDMVIEAIAEDKDKKRSLFASLASIVSDRTIIGSNTSSLPIASLAQGLGVAQRIVGMHFFNPVEKMPLVEIIRGRETSDRAVAVTAALTAALGKFPVVVSDVPGFLVNKILTPYLIEASHLLGDGCSIKEIDDAALRFGFPMGPLRLLDEIGLDVAAKVSHVMHDAYGERMAGKKYLDQLVSQNRLGKKSGAGFYHYGEGKKESPAEDIPGILGLAAKSSVPKEMITERLVLSIVNEALRSLKDGIAGKPSREAELQIDLGSVMGFGFPPFRGGVIFYAQKRGLEEVRRALERLEKECGARFKPWG